MMGFVFIDSAGDHYDTAYMLKKWTTNRNAVAVIQQATKRTGSSAIYIDGSASNTLDKLITPSTPYTQLTYGFAFRISSFPGNEFLIGGNRDAVDNAPSSNGGIVICVDGGGTNSLKLRLNNSGTVLGPSGAAVTANTWHYLEVYAKSTNPRSVKVRLNGVEVFNTVPGSLFNLATLFLQTNAAIAGSRAAIYYDDFYVWEGSENFLGPNTHIETLFPTGDGPKTEWSIYGGAASWEVVSETPPSGGDTYIYADEAVESDVNCTYDNFTDPGSITSIPAICVTTYGKGVGLLVGYATNNDGSQENVAGASADILTSEKVFRQYVLPTDPISGGVWTTNLYSQRKIGLRKEF